MKKAIALVLAVLMLAAMLTACGKTEEPAAAAPEAAPNAAPEETAAPEAEESDDPYAWIIEEDTSIAGKVRFWMPFKENQGMGALISEFNSVYPNIEVELTTFNNNADGNLSVNTAIMAGEVDVLGSFGLQYAYLRWENGLYLDLTDKVEAEGIDLVANWGTDVYKYDGSVYTFPAGGRTYYVAINMDAWNEAGLGDLPTEWTWDEYLAASKAMTKVDDSGNVITYGGSDHRSIENALLAKTQVYGGDMCYDASTGLSSFGMDVVKDAMDRKVQAELVDKIWFPLSVYRADNVQIQDAMLEGKIASVITENLQRFIANRESYNFGYKIGCAPYPVVEKGQTNYMSGVDTFSHYGIAAGCQDEQAAWVFLKWMTTYGAKYLGAAGHISCWNGTDPSDLVNVCFGSEEAAAELIDVESFKRCVGVTSNPSSVDTIVTANTEVMKIAKAYILSAMNGEISVEEALANAQAECDAAINEAK